MISNMASCIVDALIRNKVIDIQSTSVYQYGFEIFISSVLTVLIIIISGILFHCLTAAIDSLAEKCRNTWCISSFCASEDGTKMRCRWRVSGFLEVT